MLLTPPSQEEVKEVLWSCNLNASPGTDGISALLYKVHWDILGKYLSSIVNKVFSDQQPPNSQQTILMIFANKPKKPNSIQAKDKSRISLLNVDFKLMTGMEAKRMRKTMNHTISPLQLVAGDDRRLHHGVAMTRDAIQAAPIIQKYTVQGYCYDLKPAITSIKLKSNQ